MKQFKYYTTSSKDAFLRELVSSVLSNDGTGYEIGVWRGETALNLLNHFNPQLKYVGVDPYLSWTEYGVRPVNSHVQDGIQYKLWFSDKQSADEVFRSTSKALEKFGDRAKLVRKRSLDAVKMVDDNSLDFVYLDGNHYYDFVLEDIKAWREKVKPSGLLIGDDFNWLGNLDHVARAVNDCFGFDYGVMADTWFWRKT